MMIKKNQVVPSRVLLVLALGSTLVLASCSSKEAMPQLGEEQVVTPSLSQPRAIDAGESVLREDVTAGAFRLLSAGDGAVAGVTLTEAGLRIEGRQAGWTTLQLARTADPAKTEYLTLFVTGARPRLATEYFAPANVAPDGKSLATDDVRGSGYFTFAEAQGLRLDYAGKSYRLPTKRELHALLPYEEMLEYRQPRFRSYLEEVTLDGETKHYLESSYTPGHGVAYAIRFERPAQQGAGYAADNSRRTAFRYAYELVDGVYRLRITARYLGEHFVGDINYVANEGFWQSYTWDDKTLELPALGVRDPEGRTSSFGTLGEYWSASAGYDDLSASAFGFGTSAGSSTIHADRSMARPVRLILDK